MNKEGLALFAWDRLLFPNPPPFYSDPSCVVSGKPVSYHEVELKAHSMGSTPTPSIPAGRHTFTSSFCLSGNHTIAGGYPIITSSTCPLASYSHQCFDVRYSVTLYEGSRPSSIIPMQIAKVLPHRNTHMHRETSCVQGNFFRYHSSSTIIPFALHSTSS